MLLGACKTHEDKGTSNKFSDSVHIRIGDLQDRRKGDSLLSYLHHPNALYREHALMALGSIQDTLLVEAMRESLRDEDASVRYAAAFALGQTRCAASEQFIEEALKSEKDLRVRSRLYESYGRTTRRWNIQQTSPSDSVEAIGFAWGMFRTPSDSVLNALASGLLENTNANVRLGAAHYFSRKALNPISAAKPLMHAAQHDRNDEVRMAAALALRKIPTDEVFQTLTNILANDLSYRVRVNAVAAFQNFKSTQVLPSLLRYTKDRSLPVSIRAAEVIDAISDASSWKEIASSARTSANVRVKALLYQAAMRTSQDQDLYKEIRDQYQLTTDGYQKGEYLAALGETLMSFAFVRDELMHADTAVIRTAAASALTEMNRSKQFGLALKTEFVTAYREAIAMGDQAVTGIVCDALSDPELGFKSLINDWQFLVEAKRKLQLPGDIETLQVVDAAIAYFENKPVAPVHHEFNHPIDWALVRSIRSDQRAVIVTAKGIVTMRLLVDEAPGSVANFVSLVRAGAYNGKFFHRVVPNFVAQGGCPRGDGSGSEPYTIRSEFSTRRYKTGSVGMASAGKDTESCQWFITHSPTPHLDGAYTIFAEVEDGMEVVHQLEVGDKILKIELPGFAL